MRRASRRIRGEPSVCLPRERTIGSRGLDGDCVCFSRGGFSQKERDNESTRGIAGNGSGDGGGGGQWSGGAECQREVGSCVRTADLSRERRETGCSAGAVSRPYDCDLQPAWAEACR